MFAFKAAVRSLGWMASDVLNVLWPMQEQAVSRAQAVFEAFEEEHEVAEPRPEFASPELRCPNCKSMVMKCPSPLLEWSGHCPGCGGWLQLSSRTLFTNNQGGYFKIDLKSSAAAGAGVAERGGEVSAPESPPLVAPSPPPSTVDWLIPAITDVLAVHVPDASDGRYIWCSDPDVERAHAACFSWMEWRNHVARPIAERIVESLAAQPK